MDIYLMIRRENVTIFTDCKDSDTVLELKKILQGILKKKPEKMQLIKDGQMMEDTGTLQSYGLSSNTAKAQSPASITLALWDSEKKSFEAAKVTAYSSPPDLPDVMKVQDGSAQENAA